MKNYIPKDKFDTDAIEYLQTLPFSAIKADVSLLLQWMQDMHWPVAYGISLYLLPHIGEIKRELLFVLKSGDTDWIRNIIWCLFAKSAVKPDEELLMIIKRIADHPTEFEINEEIDTDAREFILTIDKK